MSSEQTRNIELNRTDAQKKLSTDLLQLLGVVPLPMGYTKETLEMQMERLGQYRLVGSVSPLGETAATEGLVYVYVYLNPPAETITIEHYVGEVTDRDEENHLAVAWVEVKNLEMLASQEVVRTIRTVMPPLLMR